MENKPLNRMLYRISVIFTIFLAIITIIGNFANKIHPSDSMITVFIGLILQGLLVLNFILVIYWAIRLRFWVWLPVLALVLNWSYMTAMYQFPHGNKKQSVSENTIKIGTFNVGRFGKDNDGLNQRQIAFYMAQENVDVICFQEYIERGKMNKDGMKTLYGSSWPYFSIPEVEKGKTILPLAVYSRYPILQSKLITFEGTPNSSMWVDIDYKGKRIRIFNNHLQTTNINSVRGLYGTYQHANAELEFASMVSNTFYVNEIIRAKQAEIINQLIKDSPYPVIVCGDFNSPPSSYVYNVMKGELKDGFKTAGHGYAGIYRYFKGLLRIDYILHSSSFTGIDYYSTNMDFGSDHNPVIMELDL